MLQLVRQNAGPKGPFPCSQDDLNSKLNFNHIDIPTLPMFYKNKEDLKYNQFFFPKLHKLKKEYKT